MQHVLGKNAPIEIYLSSKIEEKQFIMQTNTKLFSNL